MQSNSGFVLVFSKFVLDPQAVVVQFDDNGSIIIVGDFQFTGRLQRLHIGHRFVRGNIADLALGGCSAAAGDLVIVSSGLLL